MTNPDTRFSAIVTLREPSMPPASEVASAIERDFGKADIRPDISESGDGRGLVVRIEEALIAVTLIDGTPPPALIEFAASGNRRWPSAAADLSRTRAHLLVANMTPGGDAFADRMVAAAYVMFVATALSALTACAGLIWVPSGVAETVDGFRQRTLELAGGKRPSDVWVRIDWAKAAVPGQAGGAISAFTTGLLPLLGREIETAPSTQPPQTVGQRLIAVTEYLLLHGPVLKDRDTFSLEGGEGPLRVRHLPNGRRPGVPALEIGAEDEMRAIDARAEGGGS